MVTLDFQSFCTTRRYQSHRQKHQIKVIHPRDKAWQSDRDKQGHRTCNITEKQTRKNKILKT